MQHNGTKVRLLIGLSMLIFVPFAFSADITKGEFKGAIDNSSKAAKKAESPAPKRKTYPFHGKLASVDTSKNLLIMEGKKQRSIRIDTQTKITRNEEKAGLSEGKRGERVTGSITRDDQGQELAVSVKFNGVQQEVAKAKQGNGKKAP